VEHGGVGHNSLGQVVVHHTINMGRWLSRGFEISVMALFLLLCVPAIAWPASVSLFDGKSLTGWEGDTKVWRVRDGAIVGGSLEGNPRNEFLATTRSYTNFILRLEYRFVGTEGFTNGGVQVRSERIANPPNEMSGYQADIESGWSGSLYDESRRKRMLATADKQLVRRIEKHGDWNRYEVRCEGRRIQIFLNGERTIDYTESDPAIPQHGLIALQIHGDNKAEAHYRALTIEELNERK
jgi:hypothetical protein